MELLVLVDKSDFVGDVTYNLTSQLVWAAGQRQRRPGSQERSGQGWGNCSRTLLWHQIQFHPFQMDHRAIWKQKEKQERGSLFLDLKCSGCGAVDKIRSLLIYKNIAELLYMFLFVGSSRWYKLKPSVTPAMVTPSSNIKWNKTEELEARNIRCSGTQHRRTLN